MFAIPFEDIPLSATPDAWKTVAAINVPGTPYVARVRAKRVFVGASDDTPNDRNINARIVRASSAAGTPGTVINSNQIAKLKAGFRDSVCSGGINYTVEPTGFDTYPPCVLGCNDRGGIDHPWFDDNEGIEMVGAAIATMALQLTVRSSTATVTRVSGYFAFEEW